MPTTEMPQRTFSKEAPVTRGKIHYYYFDQSLKFIRRHTASCNTTRSVTLCSTTNPARGNLENNCCGWTSLPWQSSKIPIAFSTSQQKPLFNLTKRVQRRLLRQLRRQHWRRRGLTKGRRERTRAKISLGVLRCPVFRCTLYLADAAGFKSMISRTTVV